MNYISHLKYLNWRCNSFSEEKYCILKYKDTRQLSNKRN